MPRGSLCVKLYYNCLIFVIINLNLCRINVDPAAWFHCFSLSRIVCQVFSSTSRRSWIRLGRRKRPSWPLATETRPLCRALPEKRCAFIVSMCLSPILIGRSCRRSLTLRMKASKFYYIALTGVVQTTQRQQCLVLIKDEKACSLNVSKKILNCCHNFFLLCRMDFYPFLLSSLGKIRHAILY